MKNLKNIINGNTVDGYHLGYEDGIAYLIDKACSWLDGYLAPSELAQFRKAMKAGTDVK